MPPRTTPTEGPFAPAKFIRRGRFDLAVPKPRNRVAPASVVGAPHGRIHIAPVGFEVERVTQPLEEDRADRVYLLTRAEHDAAAPFVEEVTRRLRRASWPVDVRVVRTDLWDVFHALASLRAIFEAEGRTDRTARDIVPLRVNVSTGTKITAIAGTLACMLWNGTPYYAQVSRAWYSDRTPRVGEVHDVVERVEPVGVYELRAPGRELVEVLEALDRRGETCASGSSSANSGSTVPARTEERPPLRRRSTVASGAASTRWNAGGDSSGPNPRVPARGSCSPVRVDWPSPCSPRRLRERSQFN